MWKLTYPGNKVVTYNYDDFGRLRTVTDWSSRVTTYTYDNASRLTRLDRPNGTYRIQEYDAASQMRFIKEYKADGTIISFQELRYDADGRVTFNFIHPKPAAITLAYDDLLYDDDNRLSTWNSQSVVFDADGNMTSGPLPTGTMSGYAYDSRNRLTSAGGSSYRYSPDGFRVEITGSCSATFVVDPNAALSRTLMRVKGGVTTYYVYGLGLLYEETGGATKTYHADQVGSTLAMTDASGSVTDRWTYAPYGAVASHSGSADTPFQFNGEMGVQTDASGLLHMRARYCNPRLMRFLNADPIGFKGGLNWYASFDNNPISKTDPTGHFGIVGAAVGGVIGGIAGGTVAYFTGGDWKAAAVGGAVSGALIGSGAGIIAVAVKAGTITTAGALGAGAVLGAGGGVIGNTVEQVAQGKSLSQVSAKQQLVAGGVGALGGVAGSAATVVNQVAKNGATALQATMQQNLNSYSAQLIAEGAQDATVRQVQNAIVNGMAQTGAATGRAVAAVTAVEAGAFPFVEEIAEDLTNASLSSAPRK